jgi:DNA polymerase-1
MVRIQLAIEAKRLKSSMILQVHDELNFEVWPEELDRMKQIVRNEMENASQLQVPLIVDMGAGTNWLEAH